MPTFMALVYLISGFFNWAGASILTVVMVIVAAFFFWLQRLVTKGKNYGTLSGKPKQLKQNSNRWVTTSLAIYTGIVVLIPLLAVLSVGVQSFATTWGADLLPRLLRKRRVRRSMFIMQARMFK